MQPNKVITITTNFNNKMACPIFPHLDLAPFDRVPEKLMREHIIMFKTADNSHPPVLCQLVDLFRLGTEELCNVWTYPSHGMDACDFFQHITRLYANNQEDKRDRTKLAMYFYKRLPHPQPLSNKL